MSLAGVHEVAKTEAVIFVGLQGSGKSSFYQQQFVGSHVRINLDTLKTRFQENKLIQECLQMRRNFVVDNTNPTIAERAKYIKAAQLFGYEIICYHFTTDFDLCFQRNRNRTGKDRIPDVGLYRTRKIMQPPEFIEGFQKVFEVKLTAEGAFEVRQK